jgi:hypothetical protein
MLAVWSPSTTDCPVLHHGSPRHRFRFREPVTFADTGCIPIRHGRFCDSQFRSLKSGEKQVTCSTFPHEKCCRQVSWTIAPVARDRTLWDHKRLNYGKRCESRVAAESEVWACYVTYTCTVPLASSAFQALLHNLPT